MGRLLTGVTLWSCTYWESSRGSISDVMFRMFTQLSSALKCSGAGCALLYFGWSGDENGNVLIGFGPTKVCHVLVGISFLHGAAAAPRSPMRWDCDKWPDLISSTLEWIRKEGHVCVHWAIFNSQRRVCTKERTQMHTYCFELVCFFTTKSTCSNVVQMQTRCRFLMGKYPKVTQLLAAIIRALCTRSVHKNFLSPCHTKAAQPRWELRAEDGAGACSLWGSTFQESVITCDIAMNFQVCCTVGGCFFES